nr:MAG TPA: hypothetical protein [Caudoviricetes sp.]
MPIRILRGKLFVGVDRELFFFFVQIICEVRKRNAKIICNLSNVCVSWILPTGFPAAYGSF